MSKIFVGNVTSEGDRLIHLYLDKFMPDAVVEPLRASGIRTKMRIQAKRPDVALVIIDEALYQTCEGVADETLRMPKVYKYIDDAGLQLFLESKFGKIDITPIKSEDAKSKEPDGGNIVTSEPLDFGYEVCSGYDSSAELEATKRELEQSKLLVKSLTQQLQDKGRNSDVGSLVERIKELETSIRSKDETITSMRNDSYAQIGKVAKAEEAIQKLSETEADLRQQRELVKQYEIKNAECSDEIKKLEARVSELSKFPDMYAESQKKLSEMEENYKRTYAQYESKCDEYDVLSQRAQNAEKGSVEDRKKLDDLTSQISDLQAELQSKAIEKSNLESSLNDAQNKVSELTANIEDLNKQLADALTKVADTESSNRSLEEKVKESSELLKTALDEAESLEKQLAESRQMVSDLSKKVLDSEGVSGELSEVRGTLENERQHSKELEDKLTDVSNRLIQAQDRISSLVSDLAARDSSITDLQLRLSKFNNESDVKSDLESRVRDLTEALTKANASIESKDKEYSALKEEKDQNESDFMREKLKLQDEIQSKDLEIKNMESEIELLKRGVDENGKTADLRNKILDLQNEILTLKQNKDKADSEELLRLQNELRELRERCAELEVTVLERNEEISELHSSVFTHMSDCAMPKLKMDVRLSVPSDPLEKCIVVSGGSSESNPFIYKVLKNTCMANKTRKILVLELVTDSYIDSEFKLKSITTPLKWLQGKEPVTNFVSDTCFNNVKVVSPALAYFNPLYLLTVDWNARLEELRKLQKSVDLIIINVGVLNNVVTKALFRSFSEVMRSTIVVRATPINIRTVLLSLAGLPNSSKSEIYCVHYDTASKTMYQKLATSYKAKILQDNEGLGV